MVGESLVDPLRLWLAGAQAPGGTWNCFDLVTIGLEEEWQRIWDLYEEQKARHSLKGLDVRS